MSMSYEDAVAQVCGPGQLFEVVPAKVGGLDQLVFAAAPATLRDLFDAARGFAGATFLVFEDERWSFADVMAQVDALAHLLADGYHVGPGDRVAIAMRNYPEWIVAFAAITSIGAVSVSLNAWWTAEELAFALEDCVPSVLVADAERVVRTAAACRQLAIRVIAVRTPPAGGGDGPADEDGPAAVRWEDVVVPGPAMPAMALYPDADATILYTSGTTGRPKGAVSTHRAVLQALMGFACKVTIERTREPGPPSESPAPPQVFILIVPLFHVTGCVPVMLSCFALGMKLVIMYRWDPERALELIERERVTSFVGVPTQSWDLLAHPRFAEFDTSSLRSVGGGGAPAPPALVERVASSFPTGRPNIGYGLTETNAYGPGNTGQDYLTHPTSTGRATPILRVAIRDPAGQDLPTGSSGEVWLKGPNLIRGYWNRPEDTAEAIVNGWLRTGDAGHLDEDGFLYIEDRLKDVILRGGENVYPAEVEAALFEHPAVSEAAVFGVPDERLGEAVAAVVVPRPGASVTPAELQAFVAGRLAGFKVPVRITVTDVPLPRNAAGKVLKRELRTAATPEP